jgi:hypothetical protein
MIGEFNYGPWHVEYCLNDGGRLTRISYKGYDLLTREPAGFRPPRTDQGQYERRPVYGYDDCFPSVVACSYPESNLFIPDHGELCWLQWNLQQESDCLKFSVRSEILPLIFTRRMVFTDTSIVWHFEVLNEGTVPFPFQHSMHPLLSVDEITSIEVPEFESVLDWTSGHILESMNPEKIREMLLNRSKGSVEMLFLRTVQTGVLSWTYSNGMHLTMKFPVEYFPTVGVWWNNRGYPNEEGIQRCECAFEPTAGFTSNLSQAYINGNCLSVDAKKRFRWQIFWEIEMI